MKRVSLVCLLALLTTRPCGAQNCRQIQTQYDAAEVGLQRDVSAIKSLGFSQTTKDVEEWVKTGKDIQDEAYKELINGLISYGLQSAQVGAKTSASMGPPQANAYITKLKGFGINSRPWFDSLRKVAYAPGKPAAVLGTKDLLEQTGHLADLVGALPQSQKDVGWTDLLGVAVSFAGGFVKSPPVGFTLAGWSFLTSLAWSTADHTIVPARIDQLANLSEQQLKALVAIDGVIHHHVADMQSASKRLAAQGCTGPKAAAIPERPQPSKAPAPAMPTPVSPAGDPCGQYEGAMKAVQNAWDLCTKTFLSCTAPCGYLGTDAMSRCMRACGSCDHWQGESDKALRDYQDCKTRQDQLSLPQ